MGILSDLEALISDANDTLGDLNGLIGQLSTCTIVNVFGTDEPKDSGIDLSTNDVVTIRASGNWGNNPGSQPFGPDGENGGFYPNSVLPSAQLMELIGKIGTGGTWFRIGSSKTFTASATGRLYLQGNDAPGGSYNNSGAVTTEVCVE